MMNKYILAMVAMLGFLQNGCDGKSDAEEFVDSAGDRCVEFDWHTKKFDKPMICRMIWCGSYHGGPAVLWCDEQIIPKPECNETSNVQE